MGESEQAGAAASTPQPGPGPEAGRGAGPGAGQQSGKSAGPGPSGKSGKSGKSEPSGKNGKGGGRWAATQSKLLKRKLPELRRNLAAVATLSTLRSKLVASFAAVLLLLLANVIIGLWGEGRRAASLEALEASIERGMAVIELRGDLEGLATEAGVGLVMLASGEQQLAAERLAGVRRSLDELSIRIDELNAGATEADMRRFGPFLAAHEDLVAALSPAPGQDFGDVRGLSDAAIAELNALQQQERDQVIEATRLLREKADLIHRWTLGTFMLTGILAVLVALWFSTYMGRGLNSLNVGARIIGGGDLKHRIRIHSRDELGELAQAFNSMADNLMAARGKFEEARMSAVRANETKSAFLASMSHELRTPMNAIIGYSEMLLEEAEDDNLDAYADDLKKIRSAGQHLLALINDVLDLSKIEAGKMNMFLETFEVAPMVEDVAVTVQPLAANKDNTFEVQVAEDTGTMRADKTKVRQTLFNLLSNAMKFTEKGTVTLSVQRRKVKNRSLIVFEVSDTGIGMNADQIKRVFDEFSQAEDSTSSTYGGTGLGLPISRKFCRMMGGDILVRSKPGQGTTFTASIPVKVKEPQEVDDGKVAAHLDLGASSGSFRVGSTVLAIDDDPAVLDLTQRYLSRQGFQVVTALNGRVGLELAEKVNPVAITLDVVMPGMDGWEVLSALKRNPKTAEIPVILMTILDEQEEAFRLGASEYMTKPVDRAKLAELVHKLQTERQSGTVLVVEDEDATRELMRRELQSLGWDVIEAENGRVALDRIGDPRPDLVLLDLMMPEMDGFEFLKRLRAMPDGYRIPVLVVTAMELSKEDRLRLNGYMTTVLEKDDKSRDQLLGEVTELVKGCVKQKIEKSSKSKKV